MLASDFGPLMVYVFGFYLLLDIFGFICVAINSSYGRNRWWGLGLALFCTLGGLMAVCSAWNTSPEFIFFKYLAMPSLVCGFLSLYLWGIDRKHWHILLLRILVYGSIIVGGLVLFALSVRRY